MHKKINLRASYVSDAFERSDEIVKIFRKIVKDNMFGEFDGIACRGTSGLLMAPILARSCRKKLIVIKKPNDGSHDDSRFVGHTDINRYVIVDDLVSSGSTLESVVDGIGEFKYNYDESRYKLGELKCVGVFLWNPSRVSKERMGYCSEVRAAKFKDVKFIGYRYGELEIED